MPAAEQPAGKRELLVSRTWIQVAGLVVLVGFFVLVLLAYRTYQSDPPIPDRVVDPSGRVVFTGDDIRDGPEGLPPSRPHGVRLDLRPRRLPRPGLHRRLPAPLLGDRPRPARRQRLRLRPPGDDRPVPDQPLRRRTRRRSPLSAQQASAFAQLERHYSDFFSTDTTRYGLRPKPVDDPEEIHQLTSFFAWSAWAASTRRPGHNYSYTNNWPPEDQVGNDAQRQRDRLVGDLADRPARRDRGPVRRLRALADGLAGPRPGDPQLPRPGGCRAHPGPAGHAPGSSS